MKLGLDSAANIVMLVLGVVLFFIAIWVLKILLKKNKSLVPAYGLFGIAIVMIGFSTISTATLPGGVGFSKTANAVENDPGNAKAVAALGDDLDKHMDPANTNQLQPEAKADLSKAVASLSAQTNLSAESRITLSKAQLVLGRTNEAAATLKATIVANPRLSVDPKIKILMHRIQ